MIGSFVLHNRFLAHVVPAQEATRNVEITFSRCTYECNASFEDELAADQYADGGDWSRNKPFEDGQR